MVCLKKTTIALLLLTLNSAADELNKNKDAIIKEVEELNIEILDLEQNYKLHEDLFYINIQTKNIKDRLLYNEYQLGTPKDNSNQWNETEQIILNVKTKLKALEKKIKLEGDWGKIRLKINYDDMDLGKARLKYKYPF